MYGSVENPFELMKLTDNSANPHCRISETNILTNLSANSTVPIASHWRNRWKAHPFKFRKLKFTPQQGHPALGTPSLTQSSNPDPNKTVLRARVSRAAALRNCISATPPAAAHSSLSAPRAGISWQIKYSTGGRHKGRASALQLSRSLSLGISPRASLARPDSPHRDTRRFAAPRSFFFALPLAVSLELASSLARSRCFSRYRGGRRCLYK